MSDDKSSGASDGEETKYDVYCSLCKTGFSSTVSYRQHLKGSKHTKAEKKEFMKKKYSKPYSEAISKIKGKTKAAASDDAGSNGQSDDKKEGSDEDAEVYTCNLCKKVCTGIVNYKTHLDGKHHAKQMNRKKLMDQLRSEIPGDPGNAAANKELEALYVTCPQLKPFAYCEQCSKSFSGPEGYQQHISSDVHKKMVQKLALVASMSGADATTVGSRQTGGASDDLDPVPFAVCKDCDKTFYDPIPYQQHMASGSHQKKVKKLQLLKEMKQHMVAIDSGEGQGIKCAECGKVFADSKALYQHLSGTAHSVQKEQLLEDLLRKFPNLLNDSKKSCDVQNGSESSDDDGEFLACAVCHKSFSGPESARDHFRSKKHLKTVKEKERIKKILAKQKAEKKSMSKAVGVKENGHSAPTITSASSVADDDFEVIG